MTQRNPYKPVPLPLSKTSIARRDENPSDTGVQLGTGTRLSVIAAATSPAEMTVWRLWRFPLLSLSVRGEVLHFSQDSLPPTQPNECQPECGVVDAGRRRHTEEAPHEPAFRPQDLGARGCPRRPRFVDPVHTMARPGNGGSLGLVICR